MAMIHLAVRNLRDDVIEIRLVVLEGDIQFARDVFPELDAEAGPLAVLVLHGKGRAVDHGDLDGLGGCRRRRGGRNVGPRAALTRQQREKRLRKRWRLTAFVLSSIRSPVDWKAKLVELTEKLLISMAGWPVVKQARALHESGRIIEASYEAPVLRGRYSEGGKQFPAGLRMRNPIDVENLCPCRDSRVRGIICAHSVAVGLEVLHPRKAAKPERARVERPASAPTARFQQ